MPESPELVSRRSGLWIAVGATLFIVALVVSAAVVPPLRPLHAFQALIYIAALVLARRNTAWGYGLSVLVAIAWNTLQIAVTHLFQAGFGQLGLMLRGAPVTRLDTMMVAVGGVGHFILIAACFTAFLQLRPDKRQWLQFAASGAIGLAYFVLIVALLLPR